MSGIVVIADLLLFSLRGRRNFIITIKSKMRHKQEKSSSQTGFCIYQLFNNTNKTINVFVKFAAVHCSA